MNLQPSELMKLAVVLYAADYTVRKQGYMQTAKGFLPMAWPWGGRPAAAAGAGPGRLRRDRCIAMGILFLGGINGAVRRLVRRGRGRVRAADHALAVAPRADLRLNPWEEDNALGKAYQLTHSLIAFGRGEWTAWAWAAAWKLHYLPEAHTDFLLAVIGEELGFRRAGGDRAVLLAGRRCFDIGRQASRWTDLCRPGGQGHRHLDRRGRPSSTWA
jgi:cell division protein FtsW